MKYAYTLKTERVREKDFPYHGEKMSGSDDVVAFVKKIQDSDIEKMLILYLNSKNCVVCLQITTGTINQANVWPREIFKHALLSGASAIILAHNHPAGDPHPSSQDIDFTKTVQEIAKLFDIRVLDHVILVESGNYSFAEEGLLKK